MKFPGLQDSLDHLPLFPLPGAVLFPSMHLPLHIFEPRYRQLVRDVRDNGLPIAIGFLDRQSDERELDESMPVVSSSRVEGRVNFSRRIHCVAGVGYINSMEELPDGRFLIDLVGSARVRIVRERESSTPYRVVRAEMLDDIVVGPDEARQAVMTLTHLVLGMQKREPRAGAVLATAIAERSHPGELADAVAAVLYTAPNVRQAWLEETNPILRLEAVTEALETMLAQSPDQNGPVN